MKKIQDYKLLEAERKLSIECFMSYLDFAVTKDGGWNLDYNIILKYGLLPELISFYYSHKNIQNEYADVLIEHMKTVSNVMKFQDPEKYIEKHADDALGCNPSVITVNKILNKVAVRKKDVEFAIENVTRNKDVKKYMQEKFKGINILKLLEFINSKFSDKIANKKQDNTR